MDPVRWIIILGAVIVIIGAWRWTSTAAPGVQGEHARTCRCARCRTLAPIGRREDVLIDRLIDQAKPATQQPGDDRHLKHPALCQCPQCQRTHQAEAEAARRRRRDAALRGRANKQLAEGRWPRRA